MGLFGPNLRNIRYSKFIPNRLRTSAKATKLATVISSETPKAPQNPKRPKAQGNRINIGSVGMTYQKVKYAWLAILSAGCFSR